MTDTRPAPYPADTKAKGWRFELDYEQIEQSDTWGLASEVPMAQHALLMMWLVSWTQIPCGSLPSDHNIIRARCRIPPKVWDQVRPVLMRGWWLADDGRLYHDTIASKVLNMLETRGADRTRQEARRTMFETIRDRDGRACVYCGHTKYLTLDHLMPVSRGGGNDERNLAIACRPCNSKKKDRTPEEAGMEIINKSAADRWRSYKESAGEKRSNTDEGGSTQRNDTGTGTLLSPSLRSGEGEGYAREADPPPTPTPAGVVCRAMRQAGIADTNPGHPRLLALLEAGATSEEFLAFVPAATDGTKSSPFAYVLGAVENERRRASIVAPQLRRGAMPNKADAQLARNKAAAAEWAAAGAQDA